MLMKLTLDMFKSLRTLRLVEAVIDLLKTYEVIKGQLSKICINYANTWWGFGLNCLT